MKNDNRTPVYSSDGTLQGYRDDRTDYGEPVRPCRQDPAELCSDCRNCETTTPDPEGGRP